MHVFLRHGRELAPELVEGVAVEPARARLEPGRVDEMGGPDPRDVHLQRRVLAHEHSGSARMIEVDVRQEQMPDVSKLEPACAQSGFQLLRRTTRPTVEEGRAVSVSST